MNVSYSCWKLLVPSSSLQTCEVIEQIEFSGKNLDVIPVFWLVDCETSWAVLPGGFQASSNL